jgi:hypothetical protein
MKVLDQLPYESLSSEFRSDCDKVVRLILSSVRPKLIMDPSSPTNCSSSINVSPGSLLVYAESICEAFNSDGIPRLDDMFSSTSRRACQEAVDRAKRYCSEKFESLLTQLPHVADLNVMDNLAICLAHLPQPLDETQVNQVVQIVQADTIKLFTSLALGPFFESTREDLHAFLDQEIETFRRVNSANSQTVLREITAALLSHLESQVDSQTFTSFDAYCAAQSSLSDFFEEVSPLLGPACGEVALEYMNQCESLREKMRLEFRLSEAEREADLQASRVEEEKARVARELAVMEEQVQRTKEEHERQILFFQEEQTQLSARVVAMSEEAEEREEVYKNRISSLARLHEVELARLETETKAEFNAQINLEKQRTKEKRKALESALEEKEEEMRGERREQEQLRQELEDKIQTLKKKRKAAAREEVHIHHRSGPGLAQIVDKALEVGLIIAQRFPFPWGGLPVPMPVPGGGLPVPMPVPGGGLPGQQFPGPCFPGGVAGPLL